MNPTVGKGLGATGVEGESFHFDESFFLFFFFFCHSRLIHTYEAAVVR
jgi:hypothetical protein